MKFVRSILALQHLVGVETSLSELVAVVRSEMQLKIPSQQRDKYMGITHTGTPSARFGKLYNAETMEYFVIAELTGAYMTPIDRPDEIFLFACERVLVAGISPGYAAMLFHSAGASQPNPTETLNQLDARYKSMKIEDSLEREVVLEEVATSFVVWACRIESQQENRSE